MSELTFDERIDTVESLLVKNYNDSLKLRTDPELDAVREDIFNKLTDLENRVTAVKNNLEMVSKIINTANGN
jgi:hypothetical protein